MANFDPQIDPMVNHMKKVQANNVDRVRRYLRTHLGCTRKEVCIALGLSGKTVARAIKAIRSGTD